MKQYRITASDITPPSDEDCVLSPDDPAIELVQAGFLGELGSMARLDSYIAKKNSQKYSKFWDKNED